MIRLLLRQPGAGSSVVCFSKDVKVPVKVRRPLSSVGTSSSNTDFLTKTTSGAKRRKLGSGVVHDIYDDFQQ
jgi:hypothetical protein